MRSRWLQAVDRSVGSISIKELRTSQAEPVVWWVTVEAASGGETHRFACDDIRSIQSSVRSMPPTLLLHTAARPAIGEWVEVDDGWQPVVHQRPIITISADRQIGKADLLLLVAARVQRGPVQTAVYEAGRHSQVEDAMARFVEHFVCGTELTRTVKAAGNWHVRFRNGSRVFFQVAGRDHFRGLVDIHLLYDAEFRPDSPYMRGAGELALVYRAVGNPSDGSLP